FAMLQSGNIRTPIHADGGFAGGVGLSGTGRVIYMTRRRTSSLSCRRKFLTQVNRSIKGRRANRSLHDDVISRAVRGNGQNNRGRISCRLIGRNNVSRRGVVFDEKVEIDVNRSPVPNDRDVASGGEAAGADGQHELAARIRSGAIWFPNYSSGVGIEWTVTVKNNWIRRR